MGCTISKKYPLKVWVLTIFVAPVLFMLPIGGTDSVNFIDFIKDAPILLIMILMGSLFSLPALILYWLLYDKLNGLNINLLITKLILILFGALLIYLTFFLIDRRSFGHFNLQALTFPNSYFLTLTIFTLVFKIRKKTKSELAETA